MAARVLAEHDVRPGETDRLGVHDLVRPPMGEHAVLVDAGLVRECVSPHDRLVRLDGVAGQPGHQPRGTGNLARRRSGVQGDIVLARVQEHHDLLQRGVTGAFTDAVDRALNLPSTGQQPRE